MKKTVCSLIVLLVSLLLLSGCGSDKPTPPAVKAAQLPAAAESVKQANAGSSTPSPSIGETWPTDIPAEVPKYDGGRLQRVSAPDPEKRKVSVLITNTTNSEYLRYVQKLKDAGFAKTIEMDSPDSAIYSGKKGSLEVTATASKKENNVVIMSLKHK